MILLKAPNKATEPVSMRVSDTYVIGTIYTYIGTCFVTTFQVKVILGIDELFLLQSDTIGRGKWGKMCHGVRLATPFSQLLLFQSRPFFY